MQQHKISSSRYSEKENEFPSDSSGRFTSDEEK